MELVVFQYMLIVFAQLLTVDSSTVCRHTRNTRVTKDVETMVTTSADDGLAPSLRHGRPYSANNNHRHQPRIAAHSTRCTLARDHPAVVHNHLLLPPLSHHIHTPLWPYFCPPRGSRRRVDPPHLPRAMPAVAHAVIARPDESR